MQEQNSEKVVSLSVRATKVTANVLKSAVRAYLAAQKNKSPKVYKGKQSVKHLMVLKHCGCPWTNMSICYIMNLQTQKY